MQARDFSREKAREFKSKTRSRSLPLPEDSPWEHLKRTLELLRVWIQILAIIWSRRRNRSVRSKPKLAIEKAVHNSI
jgi:hypothetical protein